VPNLEGLTSSNTNNAEINIKLKQIVDKYAQDGALFGKIQNAARAYTSSNAYSTDPNSSNVNVMGPVKELIHNVNKIISEILQI
jgi:hypothetical protein